MPDITDRRAPVQRDCICPRRDCSKQHRPGTITWEEHERAWEGYARRCGRHHQSAIQIMKRGGFGYYELTLFLGHEPKTWEARR